MTSTGPFRGLFARHLRVRPSRFQAQRYGQKRWTKTKSDPTKDDPIPVPNTVATLPLWQRLGPLTRLAQAYGRSQRKRPYVTQFCSTIVVYLAADVSAQRMNGKDYDPIRTARSLTIGGLASIPAFEWFVWLAHSFNYPSRVLSIALKVVINQLCFVPVFSSYFFGMQALLAGESFDEIVAHVKRTVPVSWVNSCKVWPAVTALNFAFVPLEYRSIVGGAVGVFWQTYLAWLNRRAELELEESREHPKVGVVDWESRGKINV